MIVIVEKNASGKIELTKEELEKLLEQAKKEGAESGKSKILTYPNGLRAIPCGNGKYTFDDTSISTSDMQPHEGETLLNVSSVTNGI